MTYIIDNPDVVLKLLWEHVYLTVGSLAIAILIALPLGYLIHGRAKVTTTALGVLGTLYVIPSLELVVVHNGWYPPYQGDTVAEPSLFGRVPSSGIIPSRGTRAPNEWDDAAFLRPIVESITDAP